MSRSKENPREASSSLVDWLKRKVEDLAMEAMIKEIGDAVLLSEISCFQLDLTVGLEFWMRLLNRGRWSRATIWAQPG